MRVLALRTTIILFACLLGVGSFNASAQYCVPNYGTGCLFDDDINDFSVVGANSTSISDLGTGCSAGSYRNMSATMSVTLAQGNNYQAFISSTYYDEAAEVYIDFNNDNTFSSNESVGGENYIDDIGNNFTLYIPAGAAIGAHRMRVVLSYDFLYPGISGCPTVTNNYDYGEVHDYTVNIIAGTSGPACGAPASTSASGTTATTSMLAWSAVSGATGYEYVVDQTATAPLTPGTFTTATSYTAASLAPNTVYHLHVRTKCGATTFSPWVNQQFVTGFSTICSMPSGFVPTVLNNNSAVLSWTAASPSVGYEIFVSSVFLYPLNGSPVATNSAAYNNLTPNSTYYAYMRNFCTTSDVSDWAIMTFRTSSSASAGSTISGNIYVNNSTVPSTDTYKVWLVDYNSVSNTLTAVDSVTSIGNYTFTGMAAGSYLIKAAQLTASANLLGQVPTYHDSSLYWSSALSAVVTSNTTLTKNIWMRQGLVTAGPGFIGGNVSLGANKGTGSGVPNMLIVLRNSAGKLVKATYTNVDGDFSFSSLPVGTYSVYPEFMGFATTSFSSVMITNTSTNKGNINFNKDNFLKNIKPRTTGIDGIATNGPSIALFPNPANGSVTLSHQGFSTADLSAAVTSITGQTVLTQAVHGAVSTIDISALRPGIYFVRLQGAEGEAVKTLVIQ